MTSRKKPGNGSAMRLGWQELIKVVVPIVFTILSVATALYVKVEIMAAKVAAIEEAVRRSPSGEQLEAFRVVTNSELAALRLRLDRLEARR